MVCIKLFQVWWVIVWFQKARLKINFVGIHPHAPVGGFHPPQPPKLDVNNAQAWIAFAVLSRSI